MNQQPKQEWIKEHPFIKGYKYLPIERIEYLLKTIFKRYRIEITGQGTSFNRRMGLSRWNRCNATTNSKRNFAG
jgi:hypothetical protein